MEKKIVLGVIILIIIGSVIGIKAANSIQSSKVIYKGDKTVDITLDDLFYELYDGKTQLATAITNKGVSSTNEDSLEEMAVKVNSIDSMQYETGTVSGTSKLIGQKQTLQVKFKKKFDEVPKVFLTENRPDLFVTYATNVTTEGFTIYWGGTSTAKNEIKWVAIAENKVDIEEELIPIMSSKAESVGVVECSSSQPSETVHPYHIFDQDSTTYYMPYTWYNDVWVTYKFSKTVTPKYVSIGAYFSDSDLLQYISSTNTIEIYSKLDSEEDYTLLLTLTPNSQNYDYIHQNLDVVRSCDQIKIRVVASGARYPIITRFQLYS